MNKRREKPCRLDPARTVIDRVGGIAVAAEVTGTHFSRVYRWMRPKEVGGTDGIIPADAQQALMDYAREKSLPLRPDDFFRAA